MNKSELIKIVCERLYGDDPENYKKNYKSTNEAVDIFFNSIRTALKTGDRVEIRGLGSFSVKEYDSYTGRNPRTGERIEVKAKKLPYFKIGKNLKELVNQDMKKKKKRKN